MGIAGTAPAYSIAATMALLIGTVGPLSAASILYCGFIMFGITLAFINLNRIYPHAGAAYAWVGKIFHPILGFFAGWSLLVSTAIFMVSGTIPAAIATLTLISPERVDDPASVMFVAATWLLFVSSIAIKGIKIASYLQIFLTLIEVAIVALLIFAAFFLFSFNPTQEILWSSFSLGAFTPQSFANGALIALFFFWGWDVTLNLSEESKEAGRIPGRGAAIAMIIVLALFMGFAIAIPLVMSEAEIEKSHTNILFAMAEKLLPYPWSYLAIVAVMLSSIGTLETSILQFTRTMYAKGRDRMLPLSVARLHKSWQTPWIATAILTFFGLLLIFFSSFYPTINQIIKNSVDAISFQVAFYYTLTALACIWHFRKKARSSFSDFFLLVLWPAISAIALITIASYSILTFDVTTSILGIGGIAIGIIPLAMNYTAGR